MLLTRTSIKTSHNIQWLLRREQAWYIGKTHNLQIKAITPHSLARPQWRPKIATTQWCNHLQVAQWVIQVMDLTKTLDQMISIEQQSPPIERKAWEWKLQLTKIRYRLTMVKMLPIKCMLKYPNILSSHNIPNSRNMLSSSLNMLNSPRTMLISTSTRCNGNNRWLRKWEYLSWPRARQS